MYNQLKFLQRSTNTEFRTLDLAFIIQALYQLGYSVWNNVQFKFHLFATQQIGTSLKFNQFHLNTVQDFFL